MKNRSELRELIMKILYQVFILKETNLSYDIDSMIKEELEIENDYVNTMLYGILEKLDTLINSANTYLDGWTMDRFNYVDQSIICMGLYELTYTKTPAIVSINEAVELAKKYSDEEMRKVINAMLDRYYHKEIDNG